MRRNCMKMSGAFIRFTLCSKSIRSSTWITVLVTVTFCRYWIILNLIYVPITNTSPVEDAINHS